MTEDEVIKLSKRMSRCLRHDPGRYGLALDAAGWVGLGELVRALRTDRASVLEVVERNNKRRFAVRGDRIRANQGHSVEVDLGLARVEPPQALFHGTNARALPDVLVEGLRPMSRHAVHLSTDLATATTVGARRGRPVVLEVDAARMHADGHAFSVSENGVWLVAAVPPGYLRQR